MTNSWVSHGSAEYESSLRLREQVLRIPLGLKLERDQLDAEKDDHFLTAWQGDTLVGCLVLTLKGQSGRMRAVAVNPDNQGQGIGQAMVKELERKAVELGCQEVYAHARIPVLGFYEKLGYTIDDEEFEEVTIPHRLVRKRLVSPTST